MPNEEINKEQIVKTPSCCDKCKSETGCTNVSCECHVQLVQAKEETKEDKQNNPVNAGNVQEPVRDEKGRFVPGFSGNPNGNPPGYKHLSTLLKEALLNQKVKTKDGKVIRFDDALILKLRDLSLSGNLNAIREIFDRMEGKPKQDIGVTAKLDMSDPDLQEKVNKAIGEYLSTQAK